MNIPLNPCIGLEEANLGLRLAQAIRQRSHADPSRRPLPPIKPSAPPSSPPPPKLRVLIIHGRNDLLVPVSNSERLMRLLPADCGCELVVMESCGHVPHEERPEELSEIITEFYCRNIGAEI